MKSVLVYTVHKAASMFLHRLTADVARELGVTHYSINYDRDFETIKSESWKSFLENESRTGCFGPIRAGAAEPTIPDDPQSYIIVLHLRDPRDVLTSLFFSHVYSHARGQFNPTDEQRKRWEDEGIDTFVLEKARKTLQVYRGLCTNLLGRENVLFVKYETLTSDYARWLEQYLTAFHHFEPHPRRLLGVLGCAPKLPRIHKRLYKKYRNEFIAPAEDANQHKRQITPGDYRRKLSAKTIEELDRIFCDVLEQLGYQAGGSVQGR